MARVRSLKPTFFTDSDLAELPPLHRLAFQGLWCHADREGRLEDKPRELKVKILPFDECDFDGILSVLSRPKDGAPGFIRRYQDGQKRVIAITRWEHQKPHPKEPTLALPAPPEWKPLETQEPKKNTAEQERAGKRNGQSGGFLVLGSGSLVLGAGNATAAPAPVNEVSAMGALAVPSVAAGAQPDRRDPESAGAPLRPEPTPAPGFTVEAPTTPPEQWAWRDFWRWAQTLRIRAGCPPEKVPNERAAGNWWSATLMVEGVTPRGLMRGFERYGQSDHWETTDPPYPFRGFMSQWEQFTRLEARNETHAN